MSRTPAGPRSKPVFQPLELHLHHLPWSPGYSVRNTGALPLEGRSPREKPHHRQYYMDYLACHHQPIGITLHAPGIHQRAQNLSLEHELISASRQMAGFLFLTRVCMRQVYQAFARIWTLISSEATEVLSGLVPRFTLCSSLAE